jgi:hypothetical protein
MNALNRPVWLGAVRDWLQPKAEEKAAAIFAAMPGLEEPSTPSVSVLIHCRCLNSLAQDQ